jgi:hypothetical protein
VSLGLWVWVWVKNLSLGLGLSYRLNVVVMVLKVVVGLDFVLWGLWFPAWGVVAVVSVRSMNQCCIFRSVPAGTDGKSRTGMQTGTRHPHVPPRPKFRPVSACFGRFGLFQPVSAGICNPAEILFWLFI